jgi:hypothetical protein
MFGFRNNYANLERYIQLMLLSVVITDEKFYRTKNLDPEWVWGK